MLKTKLEDQVEDESGFTLVELLVVILIIGILAAIAIPIFMNQRKSANDAAVESDVKNLATQIETGLVSNPNTSELSVDQEAKTVTVGASTESFSLSDGVSVSVKKNNDEADGVVANGYTIDGWHDNGKNYKPDNHLEFNSATGGLVSNSGDGGTEG